MVQEGSSNPKKRKLSFEIEKCCFCHKSVNENESLVQLDYKKSGSLFSVCRTRLDDTSVYILSREDDIKNAKLSVFYHKNCRSRFMHPFYCNTNTAENQDKSYIEQNAKFNSQFTRSSAENFDWKSDCFICGKRCHEKKRSTWSIVESVVSKSSKLFSQVLKAAELRNDREVLSRLLSSNGDLVSVEARYHRQKPCLAQYVANVPLPATPEKGVIPKLCEILKVELYDSVVMQKCVYELSFLKTRLFEISKEKRIEVNTKLSTNFFKQMLKSTWPELKFIARKGLTDLVCFQGLSENDAIARAVKLESILSEVQDLENSFVDDTKEICNDDDDLLVLHKAAIILRNRVINSKNTLDKEYYSIEEITPKYQKDYLDPVLLRFVNWLSSKTGTEAGNDVEEEVNRKVVAISSDLTYLISPNRVTPKHLGLSVYLHHTFGSKKLIEDFGELGHTLTYSELRHFLTSAALYMSSTQMRTPSDALVPTNIKSGETDGTLLITVADNWDHNEHTLSGKKSTHAMTSILVAPPALTTQTFNRIPRTQNRSVDTDSLPGRGFSRILNYVKPSVRPQPCLHPPVTLNELKCVEPKSCQTLRLKELLYSIGRCDIFCDDRAVKLDPWTVFQSVVEQDCLSGPATVLFNPIVMASPNNFSTVYTTLKRAKEQMNALGQTICPVVFDMGLLPKALEIVWANKAELQGVIPMEGGMHFVMSCFSGIGYLYGEIGLKQLLYESDVFAKNTTEQIFAGKDFDRALRAIIMIDEVLHQRLLENFQIWLNKNGKKIPDTVIGNISQVLNCIKQCDVEKLDGFLEQVGDSIVPLIDEFRSEGRDVSPLFQFWDDYLQNVSKPIKLYLAASRHAIWDAHHFAKLKLLPFLFAANRTSYARYMTYMFCSMNRLPDKAIESFCKGNFVAKLTAGTFNSVWMDYVLEVTENKALKSSGGIIGLTHNESALVRWFLARPLTASYSLAFKGLNVDREIERKHHTDTNSFKDFYNTDVSKLNKMFTDTFIDPFCLSNPSTRLVNFATGIEVSVESESSLLNCYTEGQELLKRFVDERLVVQEGKRHPSKSFFDPMLKSKVKPVKGGRQSFVNSKSKEVRIGGEEMYLRLLAINSFKKVPLERVMSFENAPVPISLFDDNGKMISNKKSDFMEKLESLIEPDLIVKNLPNHAVDTIIFDAMAIMQMLQPVASPVKPTFSDIAELFWSYVLNKSQGVKTVHVVFDRYFERSLKNQTREKRGSNSLITNIQPNMAVIDYKLILASASSKTRLSHFYTKYVCEKAHELVPSSACIVVSGGLEEKAVKVERHCISYIPELYSNQEEADTRMLLHIKYSGNLGARTAVLVSPDTDVIVLLAHHYFSLGVQYLFFKTGRTGVYTNYTRFIPVHDIIERLTLEQRNILLPVYCLSGCDTCSSFFGVGKKKVFKVLIRYAKELEKIALLGNDLTLNIEIRSECTKFVGLLYGVNSCKSLNKLRAEKVKGNKCVKPRKLPPTDDSFLLHMLRCTNQLYTWKKCLSANLDLPDPLDFGYLIDSYTGNYKPQLMSQPCAPPELLSDLVCDCLEMCDKGCVCVSNEQPCTNACECKAEVDGIDICKNVYTVLANTTNDSDM